MICQKVGGQRLSAPEVPLVTCRLSSLAASFSGHLGMNIKEHSGKRSCKNKLIKIYFFFYSCCFQRTTPSSPTWTLDFWARVFSAVFTHLEPTILFFHWSAVFTHLEPTIHFFHWSAVFTHLEPTIHFFHWSAVFTHLEPTIHFLHWSAVFTHLEPTILFFHWSAVSHTGNDMTSLICSRPIRSLHFLHTSPTYYLYCNLTPVLIVGYRFCCNYLYVLLVINKEKKIKK